MPSLVTRLYLAVLFPESFRIVALVLHTFDTEPSLLMLLGLFIASIQFISFHSVLQNTTQPLRIRAMIALSFVLAMGAKVVSKMWFYSHRDIWLLGGFT